MTLLFVFSKGSKQRITSGRTSTTCSTGTIGSSIPAPSGAVATAGPSERWSPRSSTPQPPTRTGLSMPGCSRSWLPSSSRSSRQTAAGGRPCSTPRATHHRRPPGPHRLRTGLRSGSTPGFCRRSAHPVAHTPPHTPHPTCTTPHNAHTCSHDEHAHMHAYFL